MIASATTESNRSSQFAASLPLDSTEQPPVGRDLPTPSIRSAEELFRQLVHDHQQRLYRFIVKHIGWGTDAEELTQQAFVEAAHCYSSFRGQSELSTWLYGIAMNLVRNHLSRSPYRRYQFQDDEVLADTSGNTPDPSEQLAQTQHVRALQRALDELPKDMREVLLLVAYEEMSYEEAALMLSIPVGTVRSRVSRARTALRKRLSAQQVQLGF